MSSDVFRRVGRGGAGNFYSKKDLDEVEKNASTAVDVEGQKPAPLPADTAAVQSTGPVYSRAGRGGAGNFYEPGAGKGEEAEEAQRTKTAVAASTAKPKAGLSGRGGVGNWTDTATQVVVDEKKKQEDLAARVLQDVEAGLAMPPRTYRQHDRAVEK